MPVECHPAGVKIAIARHVSVETIMGVDDAADETGATAATMARHFLLTPLIPEPALPAKTSIADSR